ncbi:MAG: helix-turn-helix transcriptional regulator [Ignavibacteriae bacterium]|nr:helix-turn-helix transcriptional regulator [Ignavibacteriota bacterium]
MKFREHRSKLKKDLEFEKEYKKLIPIYDIIRLLIKYRIEMGITQEELARRIGTKQSAISRLESTQKLPSLNILNSIANAMNLEINFRLIPKQ